jgi:hypothetical protein
MGRFFIIAISCFDNDKNSLMKAHNEELVADSHSILFVLASFYFIIKDFLSSVVVLWRFFVPGKISKEREELLRSREVRASTAISFIMILLGIGVVASSSYGLSNGAETEHEMQLVIAIAFFSVFVFGTLTIIKFRYSKVLESESLFKDGLCSLIGTILAIALFVNSLIIRSNPSLWWLVSSICIFGVLIVTAVLVQNILILIETVL